MCMHVTHLYVTHLYVTHVYVTLVYVTHVSFNPPLPSHSPPSLPALSGSGDEDPEGAAPGPQPAGGGGRGLRKVTGKARGTVRGGSNGALGLNLSAVGISY